MTDTPLANINEEPLIWTTKGNLPEKILERTEGFTFEPQGVWFWQKYSLNGEYVKESAYLYPLPENMTVQQGKLNNG